MTNSTPTEYVKLIVSCLDYTSDGMTRIILRGALTATNEESRKWTTRFLSVLASLDLTRFADWGIRMMLGQLGDESPKVVRHAVRLLNRWLPEFPSPSVHTRIQWSAFGDAGHFLRVHSFAFETECVDNEAEVVDVIRFWMRTFNQTYLESIEDDFREMMFAVKRSLDGVFPRASTDKPESVYGVPAPLHLFGVLCTHRTGRTLLARENVCAVLMAKLTMKIERHSMSDQYDTIKSSLLALASIGSHDEGYEILPNDTIPKMIKITEEHSVLSVRGVAFFACCIVSQCVEGAKRLAALGWECNRYRYATDLAKTQAANDDDSRSWKNSTIVVRRFTHHRNSSIIEIQNRRKSEVQRRSVVTRTRSASVTERNADEPGVTARRGWSSDLTLSRSVDDESSASRKWTMAPDEMGSTSEIGDEHVISPARIPSLSVSMSVERKRANTITSMCGDDDGSLRTRSSTVARCVREGMSIPKEQLELEGTIADTIMDWHFSSKARERHHLMPFRVRTFLIINRNIGDPVRYIFMTKDEERHFADYRRKVMKDDWLYNELMKEDNAVKKTVNVIPLQTVTLPAEIEVMCNNIFISKPKTENIFGVENSTDDLSETDRGAKSGHARSDFNIQQPHSTYRCFHCSGKEEHSRNYPHPDAAALRKEVLNQVDMLEIKEYPAKRLIGLRQHHQWLFEWPCMYADVLELLDEYRFKPHSRSFLQQIFYDALKF
ncbi:unnamed protein product [Caenorhabditis bovis]|uniref:Rapamycin-insensitive companion of mTOR domain-containing protein n=1 Tax=Caenorhabditis bovis TaxID=2654633 RepID=A0A8S1EVM2_9PELO|nr:unnamed protein product [Caenorhabditis bovis]